ncbi:ATP-binding protein [Fulvivirga sedimenti]|uniref:DNA polymerase III subunit n=1 Tax=Fulvivirga sedimenti TaxID=2879465 RepID=A0A9X1HU69_9BACT|nr:DNA polymerase III subunit [Fulvivirga sedimenti]MCA6078021.1 DNA polymerase III subunit [Fulvivirga sedimenti]
MRFSDIHGMEDIKHQLVKSAAAGKIAHAQLFSGRPGAPNLPMALAYATYLNCESPTESDACGECAACTKNNKFIHPDLHFVFPVSGTKSVKSKDAISQVFLKEWRTFLQKTPNGTLEQWAAEYGGENKQVNISKEESRQIIRNLTLKAFEGKYKIMLIWLPEFFHPFAANGILKILEEPPENTVFLLVSNESERLLGTILSRTQMVQIRKHSPDEITQILSADSTIDPARIRQAARICDGDVNEAYRLLDKLDGDQHHTYVEWVRLCYDRSKMDELVRMAEDFHRSSKIEQKTLFQYGLNIMRECMITFHAPELSRSGEDEKSFLTKFSKLLSVTQVEEISARYNEALFHLERNGSPKMTFLDTSLQIMKIFHP